MIVRNYTTNLIFFAQLAVTPATARQARHSEAGPPQRGRPATARQADDVPIAIERSISNATVYHILSCFLIFTGAIADTQNKI
jgi:hypothetical protein